MSRLATRWRSLTSLGPGPPLPGPSGGARTPPITPAPAPKNAGLHLAECPPLLPCLPGPSCSGSFSQAADRSVEALWCGLVGLQVSLRDPSLILRGHLASGRTICTSG